jgi:uncharacterized peroxidase-related enzyme
MAHIDLGRDESRLPGIRGLLAYRPQTGRVLSDLAEVLLRAPNSLSPGERELIAAQVSAANGCAYCTGSHSATAAAQLAGGRDLVERVRADPDTAPVPARLRALLRVAEAVRVSGHEVTAELVQAARAEGATDAEIHDTVLIAAAFCMYNRYVDGLGAFAPTDPAIYEAGARRLIEQGYEMPG